jgi:hypothetical protein
VASLCWWKDFSSPESLIGSAGHWHQLALHSASHASWLSGIAVALASNLVNNLPAGLIAGSAVAAAHVPNHVASAILTGVDLGPNLLVTGVPCHASLADGSATRRYRCGSLSVPQVGLRGDVAGTHCRASGPSVHGTIVSVIRGSTDTSERAVFHAGVRYPPGASQPSRATMNGGYAGQTVRRRAPLPATKRFSGIGFARTPSLPRRHMVCRTPSAPLDGLPFPSGARRAQASLAKCCARAVTIPRRFTSFRRDRHARQPGA